MWVFDLSSCFKLERFLIAGLNSVLRIEVYDICVNPELNCFGKLQICEIFLTLVKNKLANGCCKLVGKLDNNDIIISTLALRVFLKVNKALFYYQIIFFSKI